MIYGNGIITYGRIFGARPESNDHTWTRLSALMLDGEGDGGVRPAPHRPRIVLATGYINLCAMLVLTDVVYPAFVQQDPCTILVTTMPRLVSTRRGSHLEHRWSINYGSEITRSRASIPSGASMESYVYESPTHHPNLSQLCTYLHAADPARRKSPSMQRRIALDRGDAPDRHKR